MAQPPPQPVQMQYLGGTPGAPQQMYAPPPGPYVVPAPVPQPVVVPAGPLVAGGPPPPTAPGAQVIGDPMVDGLLYFPSLFVKQKPVGAMLEMMCGIEIENKYKIYNPHGVNPKQEMLIAQEESTCCCRQCCGPLREFVMPIVTASDGKEVLRMERPFHCGRTGGMCCCACDGCFQTIRVLTGKDCREPNKYLGRIREDYYCWRPQLRVLDEHETEIYRIVGDCCITWSYELRIYNAGVTEGEQIGRIKKKWSGAVKEFFTDADNFVVDFPPNANGYQRMLLMGALFFIDFLFFEKGGKNRRNNAFGF